MVNAPVLRPDQVLLQLNMFSITAVVQVGLQPGLLICGAESCTREHR